MKCVLDTHVWIWWHMNPQQLSAKARELIADPQQAEELFLSAISPWEFCKLLEKGKLEISCDPEKWMDEALDMPRLRVVALTPRIAYRSTTLPPLFHSDPADQIIVATAREMNATIVTRDQRIRDYAQVRTIW